MCDTYTVSAVTDRSLAPAHFLRNLRVLGRFTFLRPNPIAQRQIPSRSGRPARTAAHGGAGNCAQVPTAGLERPPHDRDGTGRVTSPPRGTPYNTGGAGCAQVAGRTSITSGATSGATTAARRPRRAAARPRGAACRVACCARPRRRRRRARPRARHTMLQHRREQRTMLQRTLFTPAWRQRRPRRGAAASPPPPRYLRPRAGCRRRRRRRRTRRAGCRGSTGRPRP